MREDKRLGPNVGDKSDGRGESDVYERPPEMSWKRKGLGLHIVYVPPSTATTMPADDNASSDVNQTVGLILGFIPLELFAGMFAILYHSCCVAMDMY